MATVQLLLRKASWGKHLALPAGASLVHGRARGAAPGPVGAPMQVAQQFLAALACDWDGPLGALKDHFDRSAPEPATTPLPPTRGHHD
jgi:hypothetical protein